MLDVQTSSVTYSSVRNIFFVPEEKVVLMLYTVIALTPSKFNEI